MADDLQNRQFQQLNAFRKERTTVHVYLLSGTRFTGRIRSFDVHTVLLETQSGDMVIYGHAISTIEPAVLARGRRPGPAPRSDGSAAGGRPARPAPPPHYDSVRPLSPRLERPNLAPPPRTIDLDAPRGAPAGPAVTIVRRRSRLAPKE